MNTNRAGKPFVIASLIFTLSLVVQTVGVAEDESTAVSMQETVQMTQGKVKNFDRDRHSLTLKTSKGEKFTILVDWNTTLVGYGSLQEIEKGQGVKVWFTSDGIKFKAVKLEQSLTTGC